jgi:hypothetical protein
VAYGVHQQNVEKTKQRLLAPYKNGIINPRDFGIDVSAHTKVEYLFPFADVNLEFDEVCLCCWNISFEFGESGCPFLS